MKSSPAVQSLAKVQGIRVRMRPPDSALVLDGTVVQVQPDCQHFVVEFGPPFGSLKFWGWGQDEVVDEEPLVIAGTRCAAVGHVWEVIASGDPPSSAPSTPELPPAAPLKPTPTQSVGEYLTCEEVAALLHVPVGWVRDHSDGKRQPTIPSVKVGKYRRHRLSEIRWWLAQNGNAPDAAQR